MIGGHVQISKYKDVFLKGFKPNCTNQVIAIKKVKDTMPWTWVIKGVHGKEIVEMNKNWK